MFLVMGPNENLWKKRERLLFLGEWCKTIKNKKLIDSEENQTLYYHWDNLEKFDKDYKFLNQVYEEYLQILSHSFNELHGLNYSVNYWRIIFGEWLKSFIHVIFDRYETIRLAEKQKLVTNTWIVNTNFRPSFLGSSYMCDDYNLKLYSYIIKYLKIFPYEEKKILIKDEEDIFTTTYSRIFKQIKWHLSKDFSVLSKQILSVLSTRLLPQFFYMFNPKIIVGGDIFLSRKNYFRLQFKLRKIIPIYQGKKIFAKFKHNFELRKRIKFPNTNDNFFNILNNLLISNIPTVFIENYLHFNKEVLRHSPKKTLITFSSDNIHYRLNYLFWCAFYKEKNKLKIFKLQHGGGYAVYKYNPNDDHDIKVSDLYFTWGSKLNFSKNVKPLPSLRLQESRENLKSNNPNGLIMWAHQTSGKYKQWAILDHFGGSNMVKYFDFQKLFYENLNAEAQNLLLCRQYAKPWEDDLRIKKFAPKMKFQFINKSEKMGNKSTFLKDLSNSRMVVITANHTTFLETLSANYPTLIYWLPQANIYRDYQKKYFNHLMDVGILHEDPISAAKKLNEIYKDPIKWWEKDDVQKARQKFCSNLAKTNDNFLEIWKNEFEKELKN